MPQKNTDQSVFDSEYIIKEQTRLLYLNAPISNVMIFGVALLFYFFTTYHVESILSIIWVAALYLSASFRLFLWYIHKKRTNIVSTRNWLNYYVAGSALVGISWSLIYPLLYFSNELTLSVGLYMLIFGMIGAAVIVLSVYMPAFYVYTYPQVFVLTATLLSFQEAEYTLLSIGVLTYLLMMTLFTKNINRNTLRSISLESQNSGLIKELGNEVNEREKLIQKRTVELQEKNLELMQEIGERIKVELALRESEERFMLAMRGANDGLWDWNLETNDVYYSPRWKCMLGYDETELDDKLDTWAALVHPDDKDYVLEKVQDYLTGRADSFEVEMRMHKKDGYEVFVLSRAFLVSRESDGKPVRLVGTHVEITERKKAEAYVKKNSEILEMIATGKTAPEIYNEIALMYEKRHPEMRCSLLELQDGKLMHGGAPSMPKEYCDAVHGLKNGPNVGSCGTSTYTGKRVLVENIETDPMWAKIKDIALPHGMRCCWSEPIINSSRKVLGAFGMYYNHPALPNEEELDDLRAGARLAGIVMERDQAQKRIHELAYTDELTGLSSRAHFYQNVEQLIKTSDRNNHRFGLLYIDLDDFKSVNDSLGHDVGDLLLKEISRRLKIVSRDIDFVARLSGDEFCILVKDTDNDYATAHVAQRCLEIISKPIELSGRKFTPACSIGIAHYPEDGKNLSTILKAADTSLYAAKESGKNQYAFYKPELTHKAEYLFRIEQNLKDAVEKQQLSLVYQPQVKINTNEIIGVEALSRWNHPQLGQVPPTEFIPIAERIGMIKPLTEWVLRTACNQAVAWKRAGFPVSQMAVNISPIHFLDKDFVPLIKRIINETGMEPAELELEVTENVVQTDEQNLLVFRDLKALGILLAIDDFGTGYSSFASLKHLRVDCLKIDKFFIIDMLTDNDTRLLIHSMIQIGHNLEYEIIAEGVETVEQFNELKKLNCEIAQGYLFSKPVSTDEVTKFLNQKIDNGRSMWPYPISS